MIKKTEKIDRSVFEIRKPKKLSKEPRQKKWLSLSNQNFKN